MNRDAALKILELPATASEEEIKKKFRKLAAKYHPDVSPGTADKFKEINEAWQALDPTKQNSRQPQQQASSNGFWDWATSAGPFKRKATVRKFFQSQQIMINLSLSFKKSMLGSEELISFKRYEVCEECDGFGGESTDKRCSICNGTGSIADTSRHANGTFTVINPCSSCEGSGKQTIPCETCSGRGACEKSKQLKVQIPGGVTHNQGIRLAGQGSWICNPLHSGYTDALIRVSVESDSELSFDGKDIHSTLDIDLLTALRGGQISIRTVEHNVHFKIEPKSKHKDQIRLDGHGAHTPGGITAHVVTLNVKYPENVDPIVNVLEEIEGLAEALKTKE